MELDERRYLEVGYEEIGTVGGVKYMGKVTDEGDLLYVQIVGGRSVGHPVTLGMTEIDMFKQFMESTR